MKTIIKILVCVILTQTTFAETVQLPNGRKIVCAFDTKGLTKAQIIAMDEKYNTGIRQLTRADTVTHRKGLMLDKYDIQNTYSVLAGKQQCDNTTIYNGISSVVMHNVQPFTSWLQKYLLYIIMLTALIGNVCYFIPVLKKNSFLCMFLVIALSMYVPLFFMIHSYTVGMSQIAALKTTFWYILWFLVSIILGIQLENRKVVSVKV